MTNRIRTFAFKAVSLFTLLSFALNSSVQAAPSAEQRPSETSVQQESSPAAVDDGWPDLSNFIDQAYGFLPLAIPITEPAVGLGAVGALAFIDKQNPEAGAGFGRPNISVVGALATDNGSRGLIMGDIRYWMDDRVQTVVGAIKTSINLDFYGTGESGFLNKNPRSYSLDLSGAMAQAKYRIGQSQNWLGLGYILANTSATFDTPFDFRDNDRSVRIGGINATFSHDSRDNIFTPRSGNYLELSASIFNETLGSDLKFTRLNLIGMQYFPLDAKWSFGLRESISFNYGDTPFYMQPFVLMRGVPAMRYQGEKVAQVEAELRWQFWQRFSLLGFIGAGSAVDEIRQLAQTSNVVAGGAGLRYEVAKKYGIHMGLDVAWSRDGPAAYFQVGSAWMRP